MIDAESRRKIYGLTFYCGRVHWQIGLAGPAVSQGSKLIWGFAWRRRTNRRIRLTDYVAQKSGCYYYKIWRDGWDSLGFESLKSGDTLRLTYDLTVSYD